MTAVSKLSFTQSRNKAFAVMALLAQENQLESLLPLLPLPEQQDVKNFVSSFSNHLSKDQRKNIAQVLKQLKDDWEVTVFSDLDPSWFVEFLRDETPPIIRIILLNLPLERQKRVIRAMNENLARQVREYKSKSKPNPEVLRVIKNLFENRFPFLPKPEVKAGFELQNLYALPVEKLVLLFRQVGLSQLALALKTVNKAALRAILHRLSVQDARLLQGCMKEMEGMDTKAKIDAQLNILSMQIEGISPDHLFLELGFQVFSKAVTKELLPYLEVLPYKFPTKQGYLLKRYLEQNVAKNDPGKAQKIQNFILECLSKLA